MKPKLKLDNVRNLHDARYCAAVGIDLLGFRVQDLGATAVAEIMEWLSGPEAVGDFQSKGFLEIVEVAERAKLAYVSLPLNPELELPEDFPLPVIFSAGQEVIDSSKIEQMLVFAGKYPEARFEYSVNENDKESWETLKMNNIIGRSLLCFENPDAIYTMLEKEGYRPFAFTLGEFFEEPDGALDYEKCDEFVERFYDLLPA